MYSQPQGKLAEVHCIGMSMPIHFTKYMRLYHGALNFYLIEKYNKQKLENLAYKSH